MRYMERMKRVKKEADALLAACGLAMVSGEIRDADEDEASEFAQAILETCDKFGV